MKFNNNNFQACIFDFDGVIIASEPLHARAKQITLDNFCIKYPSTLFAEFKGRTDKAFFEFVANVLSKAGTSAEEMDAYKRRTFKSLGVTTSVTPRDFSLAVQKGVGAYI